MPRKPRALEPVGTYHVTARGNRRSAIYYDDADRRLFLSLLDVVAHRYRWKCLAYCLLTNHFHLLVWSRAQELPAGMRRLNSGHAMAFNERHLLDGHVFHDRYSSKLVRSEDHLFRTIRYIARNPVRAGICTRPEDWKWSSYSVLQREGAPGELLVRGGSLGLFGADVASARLALRALVESDLDDE